MDEDKSNYEKELNDIKKQQGSFEVDKFHLIVNKETVLGKGAFGKVYEGMYYKLPVAVKKLKNTSVRAMEDFQHEVQTLM